MKNILAFFSLCFLFACNNNDSVKVPLVVTKQTDSVQPLKEESKKPKKKDLEWDNYYKAGNSFIKWDAHHPADVEYECRLEIQEEYVVIEYTGQCAFFYFTYRTSDTTLDMLWSYKMDCTGG